MTKETLNLYAEKRKELGSRPSRQLRHEGWLPCVLYSAHETSQPIKVNRHDLEMLMHLHGGSNIVIDLDIGGKIKKKVLIKDLQRDFIKDYAIHADFLEISMTEKLRVDVNIELIGEPVGVSQQDGILEHLLRSVEVECLPTDIVTEFKLDVSGLEINDTLFVRDIKADQNLTILTQGDIAIASVRMPRVEEEEEVKPEEEEAAEEKEKGEEKEAEEGEAKGKPSEEKQVEEAEKGKSGKRPADDKQQNGKSKK